VAEIKYQIFLTRTVSHPRVAMTTQTSLFCPRFFSLLPALACFAIGLVLASATPLRAQPAAELPHWPLQVQPGPDGDPKQDPATFPKSVVPAQPPQKRLVPSQPALAKAGDGNWRLSAGWKLREAIRVPDTARELSIPGYDSSNWLDATVPGTVLTTLVDQGVYPEPTYGLNNLAIPESLNRQDYWYRNEFPVPTDFAGRTFTLTFNGINYTADVWFNGTRLGEIRGAFMRGTFDVSTLIRPGQPNALVVRVSPVPHPGIAHEESLQAGAGPNGGSMCFDGPTFFCTEGWDWIPGIRDRCAGIWQDVVLHISGPVTVGDVQVKTDLPLPDTSRADVSVSTLVENHSAARQTVILRGAFEGVTFEKAVTLAPGEKETAEFSSGDFKQLLIQNPRLWWPNGYGKPELYHLRMAVLDINHQELDSRTLRFGIRQVTYELSALDTLGQLNRYEFSPSMVSTTEVIDHRHSAIRQTSEGWVPTLAPGAEKSPGLKSCRDDGTAPFLVIKVNGRRVVCKGGNWGLDEVLKRSSRERLEPFIRMERDAHLTMIRNWCGQSTEEILYDLCDEYGLMVWNDFWLSTQNWNQQPGDLNLWLANAEDVVTRFRNHPSIVLWCGRNEGVPPPALNEGLDAIIRRHDGSRYYQPSSIKLNLLDSGPWTYGNPVKFFTQYGKGFTTELGLPSAPTADAIRAMMPAADQWPISDTWAYHDWHQADHGEVEAFMKALARQYGEATGLDDFCRKAQMLNYVGHRAMFEGLNAHLWKPASGRLIWMSHPAWPSMEWQLYSSDYDPNGSYFGAAKACEPVHVQLNLDDRKVVVANTTLTDVNNATVRAVLYNLQSQPVGSREVRLNALADSATEAFTLDEFPVARLPLYFIKLTLLSGDGHLLSDNFYWQARREEDHRLLNDLPAVQLAGQARLANRGGSTPWVELRVENPAKSVALMIKPTLRDNAGHRILPAFASDGYFSLLPGEARSVRFEPPAAAAGQLMHVTLDGWNTTGSIPVTTE
jgi:hypothetical protein